MNMMGKIAVIGSGSWATALAKLLLGNCDRIGWYFHRQDRIDDFVRFGHNPTYLTDVDFDPARIDFSSDINAVCRDADTLLLVTPSPYLRQTLDLITEDISEKNIVSAVKGMVGDTDMIVTDYMKRRFGCHDDRLLVIGGPCHAEEVALDRPSFLTIGCRDPRRCADFAAMIDGKRMRTILSNDVDGIEYAAVLKNVYAITAGMIHGQKTGDNFIAMTVSNAVREMRRFMDTIAPMSGRDICRSAYLGDLLVTSYSKFSRNHNFGSMIGKGYSVKAAIMEMEMVAEGYYGTRCIYRINQNGPKVEMPILDAMYRILYENASPRRELAPVAERFS